jgi:signal transduction histidine kinase
VEALPRDGGTIILGARNAGEYVNIYVKDNGVGIESGRQLRIFDLFYSTKGGFGFGLWSARRNALANGGDLTVESYPGKGTTFSLLLKKGRQESELNS